MSPFALTEVILVEDNFNLENTEIETETANVENSSEDIEVENKVETQKKENSKKIKGEVFEWLDVMVVAMVAVVLIFSFFFRIATIVGDSMLQTLHEGEKVFISDVAYRPKIGDIVVISRNHTNSVADEKESELPIIKRVIALGGQIVDLRDGEVYVNDYKLEEPYLADGVKTYAKQSGVEFPHEVPMGCVFVLGDNRDVSLDSRLLGDINTDYILGRVMFRLFPFETAGGLNR